MLGVAKETVSPSVDSKEILSPGVSGKYMKTTSLEMLWKSFHTTQQLYS